MVTVAIAIVLRHALKLCGDEWIYCPSGIKCLTRNQIISKTADRPLSHDLARAEPQQLSGGFWPWRAVTAV